MENKGTKKMVGKRIKELRENVQETQKDLAEILCVTQNTVSKIENGGTGHTIENLMKIAEHYKVSLDYLCKGEGGIDLLHTLKKYICFEISKETGFEDNNTHFIPTFKIDEAFSRYLTQVAQANRISALPKELKQQWIEHVTKEFNDSIESNIGQKYVSFIPLKHDVLKEDIEFIKLIERNIWGYEDETER